jgi:hypothetical protein
MGPQKQGHITFNYIGTAQSCCNKGGIFGEREKTSLLSYQGAVHWKLAILRDLIHNYTDG